MIYLDEQRIIGGLIAIGLILFVSIGHWLDEYETER